MKAKDTLPDQQQLQNPIESGRIEPNLRAKRRHRRKKFFAVPNGSPSLAKNYRTNLNKDVDIKAVIAISVGFPVNSLTEEEIEAHRSVSVSPSMPNQISSKSPLLYSPASTLSPSSPLNATADPSTTRRLDAHSGSDLTMEEEVGWQFDGKGWAYEQTMELGWWVGDYYPLLPA